MDSKTSDNIEEKNVVEMDNMGDEYIIDIDETEEIDTVYSEQEYMELQSENEQLRDLLKQSSDAIEDMNHTINELNTMVTHYKFISELYFNLFRNNIDRK